MRPSRQSGIPGSFGAWVGVGGTVGTAVPQTPVHEDLSSATEHLLRGCSCNPGRWQRVRSSEKQLSASWLIPPNQGHVPGIEARPGPLGLGGSNKGILRGEGVLPQTASPCQWAPGTQPSGAHTRCPINVWGSQRRAVLAVGERETSPTDHPTAHTVLLGGPVPRCVSQNPPPALSVSLCLAGLLPRAQRMEEGLLILSALPTPGACTCPAQGPCTRLDPHSLGPCHGLQGGGAELPEASRAPSPFPEGSLRVTRCDDEEDTEAGPGPGRAALVSLLGSQPLRQVQETDGQGAAEQAPCGSPKTAPLGSAGRESSPVVPVAGAGRYWGQGWPASGLS
ncbi:uncharacterized protein LOC118024174 [Mirounga leonina]|uniref:uncharacterized protein LOC118024174 n=1 Tax=Mirounga leonina TaxID=9715 RepID=UPI00156C0686|nr:uncharacterized protein LOC118024174 [Mirounga leonina]